MTHYCHQSSDVRLSPDRIGSHGMKTATTATTAAALDLDRLVTNEESAAADAARFVEAAARAAARGQPVDEAKLVEALRRVGRPAADFAAEVRGRQSRLADAARVATIPDLTQSLKDFDAEQAADDAEMAPVFNGFYRRAAERRHRRAAAFDGIVQLEELKREMFRTQPDGRLKNRHARLQTELLRLERELAKLRDRRHLADAQTGSRYDDETVTQARATLARTDGELDRTRDAVEAAKLALAAVEEEMSTT